MRRTFSIIAASGSALLLLGAFGFEHIGDMAPCKMCIWQRWPHAAAVLVGLVAFFLPWRFMSLLGAAAAATTGSVGVYHAGVEQGWWQGPSTCTSGDITGLSTEDLFNQIMTAPIVRCDEIPWALGGISMAGWNAILSFSLMALWVIAARRQ
jgi:disulfide bond formation protein DsbB